MPSEANDAHLRGRLSQLISAIDRLAEAVEEYNKIEKVNLGVIDKSELIEDNKKESKQKRHRR